MTDRTPRVGVIGVPGGWSSEKLADTVAERTGIRVLIDMSRVEANLFSGRVMFEGEDLADFDALIVKKIDSIYSPTDLDRLEVLRFLEGRGVAVFSKPDNLLRLVNRLACTVTLRCAGVPMPETVVLEDVQTALEVIPKFGCVVLKPLYSTKARGMMVVDVEESDWADKVQEFKEINKVIYLQKMVDIPGRDLGVVFLGGQYVSTYARVNTGNSWNTTRLSGGRYEAHEPSDEVLSLAEKAQRPFGLDFTCVDVVETADGPKVFEVSAFGGYRGLNEANGIDAASLVTNYVLAKASTRKVGAA